LVPEGGSSSNWSILVYLLIARLSVYPLLGIGLIFKSYYASVGAIRGVAQIVSYEVGLIFILLVVILSRGQARISSITASAHNYNLIFIFYLFILILVVGAAEANRSPYDFAEGESELVSGFNIEYGSSLFAFLFLAEYGVLLFYSFFLLHLFKFTLINYVTLVRITFII